MGSETAFTTDKPGLGFAVVLVHIPANRACPGRVHGVDNNDRDTCDLRFVGDKRAELKTCPIRMSRLLRLGNRGFRDTAQIFESDASGSAFGQSDETFGDNMIRVGLEPGLTAGSLFHPALSRWSPFLLKPGSVRGIFQPEPLDESPGIEIPVRIHGEVLDAEIDAKITGVLDLNLFGDFNGNKQKRVLFPKKNLCGVGSVLESHGLGWRHGDIEQLPAINCPDGSLAPDPGKGPDVQIDRSVGFEPGLLFSLGFIAGVDLGDGSNDGLGRKLREKTSGLVIDEAVELELVEGLGGESPPRDPIAGTVHFANRGDQFGFGTDKFDSFSEDHSHEYKYINRQGEL